MMSLMVAVVRKSVAAVAVGFAAAAAGAACCGDEHATASNTAPPAEQSPQNAVGLMRSTSRTHTTLKDCRMAELQKVIAESTTATAESKIAESELVRSLPAIPQFCHPAISS